MNKSLLFLCLLGFWFSFFIPCLADNNSDEEFSEQIESYEENEQESIETSEGSGMVYASGEEYERIYAALMNYDTFNEAKKLEKYGFSIVKESITPQYYIDLEEVSKKGKIVLYPSYNRQNNIEIKSERVYQVKVVDENGKYAGEIAFYLKDGVAIRYYSNYFVWQREGVYIEASPSYADHAERIRKLLGAEKIISPNDVKLVTIYAPYNMQYSYYEFFYIYNEDYQTLISVGAVQQNEGSAPEGSRVPMIGMKQLKEYADQYVVQKKTFLRTKAQWEEEHPGQTYVPPAGGGTEIAEMGGLASDVQDINDIASYLNIDYSQNWDSTIELGADLKPVQNNSRSFLPVLFVSIGALLLILGVVVFLIVMHQIKRKKSIQS